MMRRYIPTNVLMAVLVAVLVRGIPLNAFGETGTSLYVVAVSGQARLIRSGSGGTAEAIPLTNGMRLARTDTVVIGGNAHVVVIADDGRLGVLRASCRGLLVDCMTIRKSTVGRKRPFSSILRVLQSVLRAGETEKVVSACVRGSEPSTKPKLVLLSPRNCAIADTCPTLIWQPVSGAISYRVTVSQGLEPVWEADIDSCKKCESEVPGGILVRGANYFWTVTANLEDSILEETAGFRVLPLDSVALLKRLLETVDDVRQELDPWAYSQLVALTYTSFGLYSDALQALGPVVVQGIIDEKRKRELLLGILRSMGVNATELKAFNIR